MIPLSSFITLESARFQIQGEGDLFPWWRNRSLGFFFLFLPPLAWWNVHERGCKIYRSRLLSLSTWWNKPFCGVAFFQFHGIFIFIFSAFRFLRFLFFFFQSCHARRVIVGILFFLIDFKFSFSISCIFSFFFFYFVVTFNRERIKFFNFFVSSFSTSYSAGWMIDIIRGTDVTRSKGNLNASQLENRIFLFKHFWTCTYVVFHASVSHRGFRGKVLGKEGYCIIVCKLFASQLRKESWDPEWNKTLVGSLFPSAEGKSCPGWIRCDPFAIEAIFIFSNFFSRDDDV